MDTNTELAPPVVAVVVVHEPEDGFDEVLEALAGQDYPNLRWLFLVAGDPDGLPSRIRERVPGAFVRAVVDNPGYGAAANEALHLVDGDNGFLLLMHDDVALDPGATRLMVEELYRSNAGIVGPKLVLWDDPTVLHHVGLGVDRFGQTGDLQDLYRTYRLDADAIVDAAAELFLDA